MHEMLFRHLERIFCEKVYPPIQPVFYFFRRFLFYIFDTRYFKVSVFLYHKYHNAIVGVNLQSFSNFHRKNIEIL